VREGEATSTLEMDRERKTERDRQTDREYSVRWHLTLGLWQHEEDASKLQLVHSRQVHELQELVC
jgi:hypothetical protein